MGALDSIRNAGADAPSIAASWYNTFMFDEDRIRNATSLSNVEVHDELGSTNDRAIELIKQNATAFPAAIVTLRQTSGRGQRHRQWWSTEGSLTFSWLQTLSLSTAGIAHSSNSRRIPPNRAPTNSVAEALRLLPLAAGLAVAESIESISGLPDVKIKWPNDILIGDRKVAGILIESVVSSLGPAVVVGVGINVNNQSFSPIKLQNPESHNSRTVPPTSLMMESGKQTSLESLLIDTLNRIDVEFAALPISPDLIVARCNARLAFMDTRVVLESLAKPIADGICVGISSDGGLILQPSSGSSIISPSNDPSSGESPLIESTPKQRTFFSGSLRPA
ncbi:MAG: BirA family biotin operon repressor/biotin-[acetyl-CoA-carboxylase] ligase [Mariniblastus sp.]